MIEEIAQRFGIDLISRDEAINIDLFILFHPEKNTACTFGDGVAMFNKVYLAEFDDQKEREVCLWHEIGHCKHKLGAGATPKLTAELAANAWVLDNYDGAIEAGEVVSILREAILTYIKTGHVESKREPDLEETARILGIYDEITWMEN